MLIIRHPSATLWSVTCSETLEGLHGSPELVPHGVQYADGYSILADPTQTPHEAHHAVLEALREEQ